MTAPQSSATEHLDTDAIESHSNAVMARAKLITKIWLIIGLAYPIIWVTVIANGDARTG